MVFVVVLWLAALGFAVAAFMGILLIYKYSGLNTFDILVLREHASTLVGRRSLVIA
mgnify:CR=1 FL=1